MLSGKTDQNILNQIFYGTKIALSVSKKNLGAYYENLFRFPKKTKLDQYKQANKNFRVFKKHYFSKKTGFSENFMPENLWNLVYALAENQKFPYTDSPLT